MVKKKTSKGAAATTNNLIKKLKKLNKQWESAEAMTVGAALPDDEYIGRIDSATLVEAKVSSRLQIDFCLTILQPAAFEGKKVHKYQAVEEEKDLPYIKGIFETLEIDCPEDLSDIGAALEECQGLVVELTVKNSNDFMNIYFNEVTELGEEEADEEEADEEEDEEEEDEEEEDEEEEDEEEEDEEEEDEEEEDEEEDEEDEEESYTEAELKKMSKTDLVAVIKEQGLKVNLKKVTKLADIRKAVISQLI